MEIQRLTEGEGDRWRAIRLRALADAPDAYGTTLADALPLPPEEWTRQVKKLATFVAVHEGQDVGVARGLADDGDPTTALLLSMWVAPEARGRGAGDALVSTIVEWARAAGFRRVTLDVADQNGHAIALYARHGFAPTGSTSTLPPPREHVSEHQRALEL